ncbi:large with signal peptide [Cryptosporidium sp. chipmunk genotype I]|uniref:large with signal peptide n=1 Tax=Cryptosporidium sp. chipmunk genotype I TaxID=1280935 RepID=UPI00351A62CE|nr:large with signal peptide [Cryptosporidium sp. chipmunk genotype I]
MNKGIFKKAKLFWILLPIITCIVSISIHIFNNNSIQRNNKVSKFWSGIFESGDKLFALRKLAGFSRNSEYSYMKYPILRPKYNIREKNKASTWNDLGVVLQSKWPQVPLEASLVEFLSEFYQGVGRTFENLVNDLINLDNHQDGKKIITARLASELVDNNLGIKLMETMVINRYYSPRIESIRALERSQRNAFGIICKKASWIIVVYQEETIDTFCDSNDLYNSVIKGRFKGFESVDKYDLSFSKFDIGKEHIIENKPTNIEQSNNKGRNIEIYAYIDFSEDNSIEILNNLWNVWVILKDQDHVRIKIRHCDNMDLTEEIEYLSGFGVSVSKLPHKSNSTSNLNSTVNVNFQSQYQLFQGNSNELGKSHKDEEYENLAAMCDKAVNMENVLDSDADLSIECMRDIGAYLVSLSKRFEDQLGAMIHYLENFGTYQLALCNGLRENTTLSGYGQLNERVLEGSTFFTLNGRLFSPTETNFFNLATLIKSLIFSKIRLMRNKISDEIVITDSLSITGVNEKEELNLFIESINGNLNDSKISNKFNNVIKDEGLKSLIERGEILDFGSILEFEKDLEQDPALMDDTDWLGKREYVLSSSSPWLRNSPRTDWRVSNTLPLKSRHFYKDITNIGDSQWGETPTIFEKVWFNRNITEINQNQESFSNEIEANNSSETKIVEETEYSPWIMYRIYFSNQVRNSKLIQDYPIYDIMKEPENTLGQYLYPLESLPELFEEYPDNVGIYPVKAAMLDIIIMCDPFDIECITVTIEIINKKWPIKLNLLLIDPEWVNSRKPDYSSPFSYKNVTSEEDFQAKFRDHYENRREREINQRENQTLCGKYYGEENIQNCPEWINKKRGLNSRSGIIDYYEKFDSNSKGEYAIKLAVSEVFGFLVSSSTIQGMFLARAFLEMVAKNLPLLLEEEYTLSHFQEFLSKFFTHFSINAELTKVWEIIYSNNPNDISYVNKAVSYCRLKGFTTPGALVNGYFVEITDLILEEVIYGIAKKEQRIILKGVKQGQITNSDDIYHYIFNNTLTGINSVPIVFPPFTKSMKFENWPFIGIQNEWKHIEKEINFKLHEKYDIDGIEENNNSKNGSASYSHKRETSEYQITILEEDKDDYRVLLNLEDLSSLEYSTLWDTNPELKQNMENVEKKSQSTPWITFIALVRSSRIGLLGLSTLIDYWISTLSYQASMHLNQYHELLFNRRFRLMFTPPTGIQESSDISLILEKCIDDVLYLNKSKKEGEKTSFFVPILEKLRFIKWFIRVVLENMDEYMDFSDSNTKGELFGERIIEIYESLSISFFGKAGNGKLNDEHLEDLDLIESQNRAKEKLLSKFSSRKEKDVISFPYSSVGNGKLKGFPKYANYNLSQEKSDQSYGRGSFQDSELSNKDCFETFTMGIVVNGVYLRICPNTYPVYLRKDVKVNYWSSPIHSVHFKLLETAVTNRMRQLVLLGEFKRTGKKEDLFYRKRWSKLDPNKFFVLFSEHLHISNLFKSESLIQIDDIFSSSNSLIKLHLPTVNTRENSKSKNNALIQLVAVVNPITAFSTNILRLFDILHQLLEADVKLVYNPVLNYQNINEISLINTWRRYVFNYPKLKLNNKDSQSRVMTSLKELMYSKADPSEFKIGKDDLYYFNSQFIAKFDIQTENRLQINIERSHDWSISYLKAIFRQSTSIKENDFFIVPGNISNAKGELLVYELKGKEFEATLIDLMSSKGEDFKNKIKEIQLILPSSNSKFYIESKKLVPIQKIYSLTDYNSFFGYIGIGYNDLVLTFDNYSSYGKSFERIEVINNSTKKESLAVSFPVEIFNQRLFDTNQFVVHLSKLSKMNKEKLSYVEFKEKSRGLLRELHIFCLSTHIMKKEMVGDIIDKLIDLIDKGFTGKSGYYYNKFIIYFDSRDISQTIRDYYSYKLFWKYYISIEYLEITRPKWIPRLSSQNNNSMMDILLTLEHWIPPRVEKLLILDPFLLNNTSDLDDYFDILSTSKTRSNNKIKIGDSAMIYLKKGDKSGLANTKMGLILVNNYKRIGSYLKRAYFEMYYDFEIIKKSIQGENKQSMMDLFISYLRNNKEFKIEDDL